MEKNFHCKTNCNYCIETKKKRYECVCVDC